MIFCWRLSQMSMSRIKKWWRKRQWRKPALKRKEYPFVQMKPKVESASLLASLSLGRLLPGPGFKTSRSSINFETTVNELQRLDLKSDWINGWLFTLTVITYLILSNAIYHCELTAKNCFKLQSSSFTYNCKLIDHWKIL